MAKEFREGKVVWVWDMIGSKIELRDHDVGCIVAQLQADSFMVLFSDGIIWVGKSNKMALHESEQQDE